MGQDTFVQVMTQRLSMIDPDEELRLMFRNFDLSGLLCESQIPLDSTLPYRIGIPHPTRRPGNFQHIRPSRKFRCCRTNLLRGRS